MRSDFELMEHFYHKSLELEDERDRLLEEVLGLRGADIPVLKREVARLREDRDEQHRIYVEAATEVARLRTDYAAVKAAHDANAKMHGQAAAYYKAMKEAEAERDQWEQKALDAEFERDRLRDLLSERSSLAEALFEAQAERDRLRAMPHLAESQDDVNAWLAIRAERDRLVQQNSEAVLLVAQLRARNGRLRKAVNWLRGALHDESHYRRGQTIETCDVWECQRARDILKEAKDE